MSYCKGIDISVFQSKITSYQAIKDSGVDFAYVRGLYGTAPDKLYQEHIDGLRGVGILVGAYQFTLIGAGDHDDPSDQANAINEKHTLDLPVALDIESMNKHTKLEAHQWVDKYVQMVMDTCPRLPVIYTGRYFWDGELGEDTNFDLDLWHAQYTTGKVPSISAAWKDRGWKMWQYLGNAYRDPNDGHIIVPAGTCPGITGAVDLNYFNGTLEELVAWAESTWQGNPH